MQAAVESVVSVREALGYLLAHDRDEWRTSYLCVRLREMKQEGVISRATYRAAKQFINDKIYPYLTLVEFHLTLVEFHLEVAEDSCGSNAPAFVESEEWPVLRREYLKQWIKELS